MFEYLFTLFLFLLLAVAYKCIVQPHRRHQAYVKAFRDRGYRVLEFPFKALGAPALEKLKKDEKEGDAFRVYKKEYSQHDVVISNIFNIIYIEFCEPGFMKDFYSKDNHFNFPKVEAMTRPIKRFLFGGSIAFSEGE